MFGFVGTIVLAVITNLVLPLLGVFDLQQMGPFGTIIFSSSIVLSMVRNKFLSSNIILGRGLEMITMSALTYLLFYIVLFIDNAFFGGIYTPSALLIGIPIAIIFTIISNNIKGILNKYVYENIVNKDFNPLTELNILTQELSKEVQLDIIFDTIFNNIQRNLNTKKTMFILSPELFPETQNIFPVNEKLTVTHNEILHLFHSTAQTKLLVLPELSDEFYNNTNPINQKIIEKLREEKIELIFRVINDRKIIGFLLLGRKEDSNQFYYSNEVGYLKSLIDLLNSTIEKSKLYNEINAFNINLQKKIKDATASLSRANKQLKILDSAKSDFISIASHQLRTPLSIIKGYLSMLTEGDYGKVNAEQVKVMNMTFSAVGDLEEVVNELLTSSRIERGKFTITKSPNDIIELINYVQKLYSDKYKQKGLYLKIINPKGLKKLIIDFDKEKFHQVIVNLIENAFNYTPKGGVTVTLDNKQSNVLLSVKDTGIGIPEEGKKKLFARFSRLSNAQDLRPDGTGIGLFTAKIITEKHDGKIWFESEINKGTTFFVEIPKK
jgi:signal transduction histidine kinase